MVPASKKKAKINILPIHTYLDSGCNHQLKVNNDLFIINIHSIWNFHKFFSQINDFLVRFFNL